MRVVHKHGRAAGIAHVFHAPGNLRRAGKCRHRIAWPDATGMGGGQSGEQVVNVEASDQGRPYQIGFAFGGQLKLHAARALAEIVGAEITVHAEAITQQRQLVVQGVGQHRAVAVIDVDHSLRLFPAGVGGQRVEPLRLGLEIGVEGAVVIEVVLC